MAAPETPKLTVDTIIELPDQPGRPIVLIERKNPPFGWALPGGFVDIGESLEAAAVREAREETCLDIQLVSLLGCYSEPQRDPRGHTVSAVYIASATGTPVAADDAKNLSVFVIRQLPTELAFDHGRILADYLSYRENGQLPVPAHD